MSTPLAATSSRRRSSVESRPPKTMGSVRKEWLGVAALPSAVPVARYFASTLLETWKVAESHGWACRQVLSELITNSLSATGDPSRTTIDLDTWTGAVILVQLRLSPAHLIIEVRDSSTEVPQITDAGPGDEGGRGLLLTGSLASDWGSYALPHSAGKVVWASWRLSRQVS